MAEAACLLLAACVLANSDCYSEEALIQASSLHNVTRKGASRALGAYIAVSSQIDCQPSSLHLCFVEFCPMGRGVA